MLKHHLQNSFSHSAILSQQLFYCKCNCHNIIWKSGEYEKYCDLLRIFQSTCKVPTAIKTSQCQPCFLFPVPWMKKCSRESSFVPSHSQIEPQSALRPQPRSSDWTAPPPLWGRPASRGHPGPCRCGRSASGRASWSFLRQDSTDYGRKEH